MQFVPDLGTGAVAGAVIGWGLKKAMKLVIALISLYFLSLAYLANLGVISINRDALLGLMGNMGSSAISYGNQMVGLVHSLSIGAGFAGGFALGFKKG